ncbi:NUDIX hydrolase [uncultured Planktosalinus sp.]|uniref:NUDIX hydrolase n=1 Tax=uncultured Planktosalinus sp. TaxID=1810935 RepID=UPI0030D89848
MTKQNISLTVDIVVFNIEKNNSVLLIQRKNNPFIKMWALPGGFVDLNESLHSAALRELKEETGIELQTCEQLYAFGNPERDPRGHTVSIAHVGFLDQDLIPLANDDAENAQWFHLDQLPELAFDHKEIIELAISRFL